VAELLDETLCRRIGIDVADEVELPIRHPCFDHSTKGFEKNVLPFVMRSGDILEEAADVQDRWPFGGVARPDEVAARLRIGRPISCRSNRRRSSNWR
jgi:hypothetical protein